MQYVFFSVNKCLYYTTEGIQGLHVYHENNGYAFDFGSQFADYRRHGCSKQFMLHDFQKVYINIKVEEQVLHNSGKHIVLQ
jgi:hypothetical protein